MTLNRLVALTGSLVMSFGTVACGSGSSSTGGNSIDSGTGGTGTTSDAGGGTCTPASTCVGAFFGSCFAPTGACTKGATGDVCWSNGAGLNVADGGLEAVGVSGGAACFTVATSSDGKTYTFTSGARTLVINYSGNQARVTCADGTQVNFTAAAFNNSACADYIPPSNCSTGTCP